MKMTIQPVSFPLKAPFVITGYTFTEMKAIWVTLDHGGYRGKGEATGLYYFGDTPESMTETLETIRPQVEKGATREDIQHLLPPGGARNALDCAYWDLECKSTGQSIWEILGVTPQELTTVATIGIGTAHEMAHKAHDYLAFSKLKVKLDADKPIEKLLAIREVRPDAEIVIDVNQGWDFATLTDLTAELLALQVAMIEQPLPRGLDSALEGYQSPIPLGADESCLDLAEYEQVKSRYDVINIKLDKCGGLTEALAIASRAQRDGKKLMVGNMTGTSLAMAPSFVVGQYCEFVDIDGPLLLAHDLPQGIEYGSGGVVRGAFRTLWG